MEPVNTEKRKRNSQICEGQKFPRHLKRKHQFEGEKLRRPIEDEDEFPKSKNSKKCRMSWMTMKKTDFDEEDKDLERQIKMLIQTKQL